MSKWERKPRDGWKGSLDELSRRRLLLLDVLHKRFGDMPSDTTDDKVVKMFTFMKYIYKYPHGISHPELFEE